MDPASSHGLPPDVVEFLHRHIESVEKLEVLLLIFATRPKAWTAEQLAREIGSSPASITGRLADLAAAGFAAASAEGASAWSGDTAAEAAVAAVAESYRTRRVSVITCIMSRPNRMLRTFADAFRLRREKE